MLQKQYDRLWIIYSTNEYIIDRLISYNRQITELHCFYYITARDKGENEIKQNG